MTIESDLFNTLKTLAANRVYPDAAPEQVARPYIVYQQVGGKSVNFLDPTVPTKKNGTFQISVWADTRIAAAALARQVEDAVRIVPTLQATILAAPVAAYDADTDLFGTHQRFSFWFTN